MSNEPTLYDTEFPCLGEVDVESDVDMEFGIELGRRAPMRPLYVGLTWWGNWWRAAFYDPNHTMSVMPGFVDGWYFLDE